MHKRLVVALLGKPDAPTDAVEQYCEYLGQGMETYGLSLDIRRFPWYSIGWSKSLRDIRSDVKPLPKNTWFLLQYTALAWSRRGIPLQFLRLLRELRCQNFPTGVVFHDAEPFGGVRLIDQIRRKAQIYTMRAAVSYSSCAFFTIPLEKVSWLNSAPPNAHFVPVGANLPLAEPPSKHTVSPIPTIAVFGITGGDAGMREIKAIADALAYVSQKIGKLRLRAFGRNVDAFEPLLRESLRNIPVEISIRGVVDTAQLVQNFSDTDVLLFVRGPISSRRGSAIAGIACGLPVIGYTGSETGWPITDAGVVLVSENDQDKINQSLLRVLTDRVFRDELAARSRASFSKHFSWAEIAKQFSGVLD